MQETKQAPIPWEAFSPTIRNLAAGFRVRPELLQTYLTSVLGGISGAFSRLSGTMGERHAPAVSLILATRHFGLARNLQTLALEPAQKYDEVRRRRARSLWPDELKKWTSWSKEETLKMAYKEISDSSDPLWSPEGKTYHHEELFLLRSPYEPALLVNSPEPSTFHEVTAGVCDGNPLVFDPAGRVIRNAIQPGPKQRDWQALLELIKAGSQGGTDLLRKESRLPSTHGLQRLRTPFVFHLPAEMMGAALHHPASANLMEGAIALPTERLSAEEIPFRVDDLIVKPFLKRYTEAVDRVLWSRLSGSGVAFELVQDHPQWREQIELLESRIDALPSGVRRYCGGLYGLPHRFLWTALAIDEPGKTHTGVLARPNAKTYMAGALSASRWCIDHQISLIEAGLEEEHQRRLQEAAITMVEKLKGLPNPSRFSDLARRYHNQSRHHHVPVLELLEKDGVLSWNRESKTIQLRSDRADDWVAHHRDYFPSLT